MSYSKNNQAKKTYSSDEESTSETQRKVKQKSSPNSSTETSAGTTITEKKDKRFEDQLFCKEETVQTPSFSRFQSFAEQKQLQEGEQEAGSFKSILRFNILSGICGRRSFGNLQNSSSQSKEIISSQTLSDKYTTDNTSLKIPKGSAFIIPTATVISLVTSNGPFGGSQIAVTTTTSTSNTAQYSSGTNSSSSYAFKPTTCSQSSNTVESICTQKPVLNQRQRQHSTAAHYSHYHQQHYHYPQKVAALSSKGSIPGTPPPVDCIYDLDVDGDDKSPSSTTTSLSLNFNSRCSSHEQHQQQIDKRRRLLLTRSLFDVSAASQLSAGSYSINRGTVGSGVLQQKSLEDQKLSVLDHCNRRIRNKRENGSNYNLLSQQADLNCLQINIRETNRRTPIKLTTQSLEEELITATGTSNKPSHLSTYKSYLESTSNRWLEAATLDGHCYSEQRQTATVAAVAAATAAYHFQKQQQEQGGLFYLTAAPPLLAAVAQQQKQLLDNNDTSKQVPIRCFTNQTITAKKNSNSVPIVLKNFSLPTPHSSFSTSFSVTTNLSSLSRQNSFDDEDEELYFNEDALNVSNCEEEIELQKSVVLNSRPSLQRQSRSTARLERQQEIQSRQSTASSSSTTNSDRFTTAIDSESIHCEESYAESKNDNSSFVDKRKNIQQQQLQRDNLFLELSKSYDRSFGKLLRTAKSDRLSTISSNRCDDTAMLQSSFAHHKQQQQIQRPLEDLSDIHSSLSSTAAAVVSESSTELLLFPSGLHTHSLPSSVVPPSSNNSTSTGNENSTLAIKLPCGKENSLNFCSSSLSSSNIKLFSSANNNNNLLQQQSYQASSSSTLNKLNNNSNRIRGDSDLASNLPQNNNTSKAMVGTQTHLHHHHLHNRPQHISVASNNISSLSAVIDVAHTRSIATFTGDLDTANSDTKNCSQNGHLIYHQHGNISVSSPITSTKDDCYVLKTPQGNFFIHLQLWTIRQFLLVH